jgi:hypothetical protein
MKNRYKNLKALFAALLIGAVALAVFLVVACTNPAGGGGGGGGGSSGTKYPVVGLDPKLAGTWRFDFPPSGDYEQIVITKSGALGTIQKGSNITGYTNNGAGGYEETYAGNIVYAEQWSATAGVLIIKFDTGHEVKWWSINNNPQSPPATNPSGNKYYGVYYINLGNGSPGSTCFIADTNDQDLSNLNGPTETATLEDAKAKFTQGNMNQLLDLTVGDPQTKQ